jgi:hypothetical protein
MTAVVRQELGDIRSRLGELGLQGVGAYPRSMRSKA